MSDFHIITAVLWSFPKGPSVKSLHPGNTLKGIRTFEKWRNGNSWVPLIKTYNTTITMEDSFVIPQNL